MITLLHAVSSAPELRRTLRKQPAVKGCFSLRTKLLRLSERSQFFRNIFLLSMLVFSFFILSRTADRPWRLRTNLSGSNPAKTKFCLFFPTAEVCSSKDISTYGIPDVACLMVPRRAAAGTSGIATRARPALLIQFRSFLILFERVSGSGRNL